MYKSNPSVGCNHDCLAFTRAVFLLLMPNERMNEIAVRAAYNWSKASSTENSIVRCFARTFSVIQFAFILEAVILGVCKKRGICFLHIPPIRLKKNSEPGVQAVGVHIWIFK